MLKRQVFRGFAAILIAGVVAHLVTLWPRVRDLVGAAEGGEVWVVAGFVLTALTALVAAGLATLLLFRASDRVDGRVLTLFLAFLGLFWGSVFRFLELSLGDRSVEVTLSYSSGWLDQTALIAFLLAAAAFLRLSALFPRPLTPDRLPALRLGRLAPARWLRRVRVAFLRPTVVWGSAIATYLLQRLLPDGISRIIDADASTGGPTPALMLGFLIIILVMAAYAVFAMALGARNLRDSYRMAEGGERRRILWVVAGFSVAWWLVLAAAGLMGVSATLGDDLSMLGAAVPVALVLAPLVAVAGAAVGVLYSGAVDPALALERSTIYGALGVIGVVAFAAVENAASELVESWVGLPGFVGTMVAGGVVAAALIPLRRALKSWALRGHPPDDD